MTAPSGFARASRWLRKAVKIQVRPGEFTNADLRVTAR
jgi:hypothetical protein